MPKRKRNPPSKSSACTAASARARHADEDGAIDLCSSSDDNGTNNSNGGGNSNSNTAGNSNNQPQYYSGYKTISVGSSPLNDTKLCGMHNLITLESAQYAIRLVAEFMQDEEAGKSVTFTRTLFGPLWQRLLDQGGGGRKMNGGMKKKKKKKKNSSPSGTTRSTTSRNSCCWRYESIRDPLSIRNDAFVPPRSTYTGSTKKGKLLLGKDYYMSEEHVVHSILEDISTLEEVQDLYAQNAHHFTAILPILDRAVTENMEYKYARRDVASNPDGMSPGNGSGGGGGGGAPRSCNLHSFGVDFSLMADPYGLSGDEKSWRSEQQSTTTTNSTEDDKNKDECDICEDGGELVCCDHCDKAYHATCLGVEPDSLPDPWRCPSCLLIDGSDEKKAATLPNQKTSESDSVSSCDDENESNLTGVEPKINMPIEILDDRYIWNMAKITHISNESTDKKGANGKCRNKERNRGGVNASSPKCKVTVSYEGWDPEWAVELPYPNKRLARIFTFTKKVKCFVKMQGSKKRDIRGAGDKQSFKNVQNWTDSWPCKVTFRTPHPDSNEASNDLRKLDCFFVEPYMANLLPRAVQQQIMYGGQWVGRSKLRPWKNLNVNSPVSCPTGDCILRELPSCDKPGERKPDLASVDTAYCCINDFCQAYQAAQSDWIQGCLPLNIPLEEGSLLKEEDKVVDGVRYSGSFPPEEGKYCQGPVAASLVTSVTRPLASKVPFVPAPSLPPPIPITDIAYPNQGVRRLEDSNRWSSILRVAGNDLFLGSHTSQSGARRENSVCLAGGTTKAKRTRHSHHLLNFAEDSRFESNSGKITDLLNTPIESIVSAFEETRPTNEQFRLRDWMAEHYKHVQHLKDMAPMSGQDDSNFFSFTVQAKNNTNSSQKRRKKSTPKRLQVSTTAGERNRSNVAGVSESNAVEKHNQEKEKNAANTAAKKRRAYAARRDQARCALIETTVSQLVNDSTEHDIYSMADLMKKNGFSLKDANDEPFQNLIFEQVRLRRLEM